jgi:hypothetical protein
MRTTVTGSTTRVIASNWIRKLWLDTFARTSFALIVGNVGTVFRGSILDRTDGPRKIWEIVKNRIENGLARNTIAKNLYRDRDLNAGVTTITSATHRTRRTLTIGTYDNVYKERTPIG